jgi:hypothetical protein
MEWFLPAPARTVKVAAECVCDIYQNSADLSVGKNQFGLARLALMTLQMQALTPMTSSSPAKPFRTYFERRSTPT